MSGATIEIFITMCAYMALVIGIGLYFSKRANESSENYFLGGRSLGPWITAMSAEASDMSGWLLMGLPGVAYWSGLSDAVWTAIGLAVGTYINWLIVAKRLRQYSHIAGDSITIPDYFSNRFKEENKVIMTIAALFILIFFTVYASSCFVTCGKLFSTLFGFKYQTMMIAGAVFVIVYTFLGGFLAESASDFMQSIVMIIALCAVVISGVAAAGGLGVVLDNVKAIPGFFEFFGIAKPTLADGAQQLGAAGEPLFGDTGNYGFLTILSTLSWGFGLFWNASGFAAFYGDPEILRAEKIKTDRNHLVRYFFIRSRSHRLGRQSDFPFQLADRRRCGEDIHPYVPAIVPACFCRFGHGGNPGSDHQFLRLLFIDRSVCFF